MEEMEEKNKMESLTMLEYLQKEEELEEEAAAQASQKWGEEDRCTYEEGYVDQPVYACATCSSKQEKKERFGFCYGCSMNCHLHHQVFELFDKRHFRCDCGTPKSGSSCSFLNGKDENNAENIYNHNFDGLYCYCDGIYDERKMVMYQCILCLDWFHLECVQKMEEEANIPEADIPSDFMCFNCAEKFPFLKKYSHLLLNTSKAERNISVNDEKKENEKENESKEVAEECKFKTYEKNSLSTPSSKTFFWKKGWRQELCRCSECVKMYKNYNLDFLLQEEKDDEQEEEKKEIVQNMSLFETSQQAFLKAALPHSSKIDLVQGFNSFYAELKQYLNEFATSGREVTAEDISRFSEELRRKRRKLE